MKKAIGYILTILGAAGVVKGFIWLLEVKRIADEAAEGGIYFGLLGIENVLFFISLPVLIIGIFLIVKKEHRF